MITLIGTVHYDPNGSKRLARMLRKIGPDLIVNSANDDRIAALEKFHRLARAKPQTAIDAACREYVGTHPDVLALVVPVLGYEAWMPQWYSTKYGAQTISSPVLSLQTSNARPLLPIDPFVKQEHTDLFALATGDLEQQTDKRYGAIPRLQRGEIPAILREDASIVSFLEGLAVSKDHPFKNIAYVCGIGRTHGDYFNIYRKIQMFTSDVKRYKLSDTDGL